MKHADLSGIRHQVAYRFLGGKPEDGILSCGFMRKESAQKSQLDYTVPYYSCFVLLDGSGEYWDETGFSAPLGPGCVVQRLPGRLHSTRVAGDGRWLEFYISLGRSAFESLAAVGMIPAALPVFPAPDLSGQLSSFSRLLRQMASVPDDALFPCLLEAQQILFQLFRHADGGRVSPEMLQACRLLEQDLDRRLSLRQTAGRLCMGYETFRKAFAAEMGLSPDQYRQQKRMTTAQMMLLEGESVKAVAKTLGYSDAYAFSKQFKRFFGCAPSSFLHRLRPEHEKP